MDIKYLSKADKVYLLAQYEDVYYGSGAEGELLFLFLLSFIYE